MKFLRQLKSEIKNIIKSKFLLIIGILIIAAGAVVPVIGLFSQPVTGGSTGPTIYRDMIYSSVKIDGGFYPGNGGQEPITINGVTITGDNPFYWNLNNLIQEKQNMENGSYVVSTPAVLDMLLEINGLDTDYFLRFAKTVTNNMDYRVDLAWRGTESLYDKYFYEHNDVEFTTLLEVSMYKKGMDEASFRKKYIDITSGEKLAAIDKADENLKMIYDIVDNDNFPKYIELRIRLENDQIALNLDSIAILEQNIIDNPTQEENLNLQINEIKKQIKLIETNNIPLLQYRLEKNIRPGEDVWQNIALSDVENARNQIVYLVILTEEEYNKNGGPFYGGKEPGGGSTGAQTYQEYVAEMQKQIDQANTLLIIAQKSLDSNQPDMKYVPNGARSRTNSYLDYSLIVALFAVLLGGWLIASEFQQGTIRLLMIRPKTRTKILLSKFLAALLIILAIDIAGSLLNIIVNGLCYGFGDYAFPNYTISASINFFAYYLPAFLTCVVPILFAFTMSFMLSTVVRNTAVSIAIPIVLFVASIVSMGTFIAMNIYGYGANGIGWLAWTPIPFIQISSFFQTNSIVQMLIQSGATISLPYGIVLLIVLSVVFTLVSILVFKKRDIAN